MLFFWCNRLVCDHGVSDHIHYFAKLLISQPFSKIIKTDWFDQCVLLNTSL